MKLINNTLCQVKKKLYNLRQIKNIFLCDEGITIKISMMRIYQVIKIYEQKYIFMVKKCK